MNKNIGNLAIYANLLNVFYLVSYPIRNLLSDFLFGAQIIGLNHYDKDEFYLESLLNALISIAALIITANTVRKQQKIQNEINHKATNPIPQKYSASIIFFVIAAISLAAFALIGGKSADSYEALHKASQENPALSKLLYAPMLFIGAEMARLIDSKPTYRDGAIFLAFTCLITFTVGMRSFIVLYIMLYISFMQPTVTKIFSITVITLILMTTTAILRSTGDFSSENVALHAVMFLAGAAAQVDLFYMGKSLNISPSELNSYFESVLAGYFESGGGLGSFYGLELAEFMPHSIAMLVMNLSPLIAYLIYTKKPTKTTEVLVFGALVSYPIILRNPIGSWINGYIAMCLIALLYQKYAAYRRTNF